MSYTITVCSQYYIPFSISSLLRSPLFIVPATDRNYCVNLLINYMILNRNYEGFFFIIVIFSLSFSLFSPSSFLHLPAPLSNSFIFGCSNLFISVFHHIISFHIDCSNTLRSQILLLLFTYLYLYFSFLEKNLTSKLH